VGFAEIAAAGPRQVGRERCSMAKVLDKLDEADTAALIGMLALDSGWPHAEISNAMRAEGHRVSPETIGRHRRGACRCDAR
jgi:hypothetical protein